VDAAEMAFAVIIGASAPSRGDRRTIVYMVLQADAAVLQRLVPDRARIVAIVIALFARRGLWGTVDERFNIRLFPFGYHLWPAADAASPRVVRRPRSLITPLLIQG